LAVSSPPNLLFMLALLPQFLPDNLGSANLAAVVGAVAAGTLLPTKTMAMIGPRTSRLCSPQWIERAGAVSMLGFAGLAVAVAI
jgi:threonine/homoserine/homoserine lactone efflux protein